MRPIKVIVKSVTSEIEQTLDIVFTSALKGVGFAIGFLAAVGVFAQFV